MLAFPIRLVAIVCSLLIAASFCMFARDELSGASKRQQNEITQGDAGTKAVIKHHQPRIFIDGAARKLESPFAGFVSSSTSHWVRQGIPALIGLLLYGAGLGYLSRFASGRPGHTHATPASTTGTV